jgi:hypothetical protein
VEFLEMKKTANFNNVLLRLHKLALEENPRFLEPEEDFLVN